MRILLKVLFAIALGTAACPSPTLAAENPWNGTWRLDANRSTPGIKDQAAEGYRFLLQADGQIRWEIPSLGEVVKGKVDGQPMAIHRSKPAPGLTLSVVADGPRVLCYKVARNGQPQGEGRMTLAPAGLGSAPTARSPHQSKS